MAKSPDFSVLVGEAEKAVQGVKDPELKRIAFQKVLEELLGGHSSQPARSDRKTQPTRRVRARAARSGPLAYVREMIEEGFFKKPKALPAV